MKVLTQLRPSIYLYIYRAVKANSSADAKTRLDDEELISEMATLTVAGHDTTASTLSFALWELARHPEYQERMRQEIRAARAKVAARGGSSEFTMEDLDSLTLSLNAIKVLTSRCIRIELKAELGTVCCPRSSGCRRRCGSTPSRRAFRASRSRTT